jgi:hypothetical protein
MRRHHDEPARADARRHAGTAPRYSYSLRTRRKTSRTVALTSRRRATTATWTRATTARRGGYGEQEKRPGYWLLELKTWHDVTTTTATPVGFPLARYSHHAPREGRSLSTAGSTLRKRRWFYTQKEEMVLHSERGEGSATMKGESSATVKGAATVKGEGSAFNLMNQARGGFQRRFLRNARVSSSTSDGTIRGTQRGIGGRRSIRTLMR